MRVVRVENKTRAALIGDRIELAHSSMRRLFGLLGRRGLSAGGGLWISPSSGIHTMGMAFPIDVIGLDRNYNIVKLWNSVRPFRLTSISLQIKSVLELPAGIIQTSGAQIGDTLQITPVGTAKEEV
jgi:uncharacterized membrane protein (UPF0127 family)